MCRWSPNLRAAGAGGLGWPELVVVGPTNELPQSPSRVGFHVCASEMCEVPKCRRFRFFGWLNGCCACYFSSNPQLDNVRGGRIGASERMHCVVGAPVKRGHCRQSTFFSPRRVLFHLPWHRWITGNSRQAKFLTTAARSVAPHRDCSSLVPERRPTPRQRFARPSPCPTARPL